MGSKRNLNSNLSEQMIGVEEDTFIHNAKGLSKCINQRKSQLYFPDKVLSGSKLSKLLANLPTKILIFFAKLMNDVAGSVWVSVVSAFMF